VYLYAIVYTNADKSPDFSDVPVVWLAFDLLDFVPIGVSSGC
jgi:hypothetical protein